MREIQKSFKINRNGLFCVVIEGIFYDVMLYRCYLKSEGISDYQAKKKIAAGEIKRLFLAGRTRLNSVIVFPYTGNEAEQIQTDMLTDEQGYFHLLLRNSKGKETTKKVIPIEQYARINGKTYEGIRGKRLKSDYSFIKEYRVQKFESKNDFILVGVPD
jgi:hypothetical protein